MVDYSNINLDDVPELEILPAGKEVEIEIKMVFTGTSDKYEGNPRYYQPLFEAIDMPTVPDFQGFLWEPHDIEKLPPKQQVRALADFKKFTQCFNIDLSQKFEWEEDIPGKTGWVITGVKKSDEYGDQNIVKKYLNPR
jgi:hypothetical protein